MKNLLLLIALLFFEQGFSQDYYSYEVKDSNGNVVECVQYKIWPTTFPYFIKHSNFSIKKKVKINQPKFIWTFAGDVSQYSPEQMIAMRSDIGIYFSTTSDFSKAEIYKEGIVTNKATIHFDKDGFYIVLIDFKRYTTAKLFLKNGNLVTVFNDMNLKKT